LLFYVKISLKKIQRAELFDWQLLFKKLIVKDKKNIVEKSMHSKIHESNPQNGSYQNKF